MFRNGYAMKWLVSGAFKVKADMMHYSQSLNSETKSILNF